MDRPLRLLASAVIVLAIVVLLLAAVSDTVRPNLNDIGSGLGEPTECVGSSIEQGESPDNCDEKLPIESETSEDETSGGEGN